MMNEIVVLSLCVLIGVVASAWHHRRREDRRRHIFPCRIRHAGLRDGVPARSWRRVRAHWDDDVLVVKPSALQRSTRVSHVRCAHHILELRVRPSVRSSASIHLDLDDGSTIQVTTSLDHLDALAGPFLAAHPALAQDRIDRRR